MKQLIIDEINQIDSLEERVIFKDLMNQVFLALYEKNQEMYQQLEDKIFHEIAYNRNQFSVITGLMEKKYFDASHHIFAPMLERDLEEVKLNLTEIMETVQDGKPYKVMQVFLECDYLKVKEILHEKNTFAGSIKTEKGEYRAEFELRQNLEYIDQIKHLYELFIQNGVRWHTVNAPYVNKIADVYLTKCEAQLDEKTLIEEVKVEFLEEGEKIRYDCIPVWNIKREQIDSVGFPDSSDDERYFEHNIALSKFKNECGILVESTTANVYGVHKDKDKLTIRTDSDQVKKWDVLLIRNWESRKLDHFSYPVLGNIRKNSFTERLYEQNQVSIKTNAELIRCIESYDLGNYLRFDHYSIVENDNQTEETYSLSPFIVDEIRQPDAKKKLVLYMEAITSGYFINRDILSFLVTEVQILYPEYLCEGRLL